MRCFWDCGGGGGGGGGEGVLGSLRCGSIEFRVRGSGFPKP